MRQVLEIVLDQVRQLLKLAQTALSFREHREPRLQALALFAYPVELLAELELAAGEKPRPGDVSLPEDTKERARSGPKTRMPRCGRRS
jgi:hypothetical protein